MVAKDDKLPSTQPLLDDDSGHQQDTKPPHPSAILVGRLFAKLLFVFGFFFILSLIFHIIIYLFVYLPSYFNPGPIPSFTLRDVKIHAFNVSTSASTLTSNLQITIFCQNTNQFTGIHIERIEFYASYRNQEITQPTTIPGTYLGLQEVTVWSPFLNGTAVQVIPELLGFLSQDLADGEVLVSVKGTGWMTNDGTFVSARYEVEVSCVAYVGLSWNATDGSFVGLAIKDPLAIKDRSGNRNRPFVEDPFGEGCRTSLGTVVLTK